MRSSFHEYPNDRTVSPRRHSEDRIIHSPSRLRTVDVSRSRAFSPSYRHHVDYDTLNTSHAPIVHEVVSSPQRRALYETAKSSYIPVTHHSVVSPTYERVKRTPVPVQIVEHHMIQDTAELDRLTAINQSLMAENERLREELSRHGGLLEEISHLKTEIVTLRSSGHRINDLETRIHSLTEERSRLASIISEKTQENDSYKLRITQHSDYEARIHSLMDERERLSHMIAEKSKECDSYKLRMAQFNDYESRIHALTEERNRLSVLISEKIRECDSYKLRVTQHGDIEQRLTLLLTEKERLTTLISEKLREIELLKAKAHEAEHLSHQVRALGDDKHRLNEVIIDKSRENEGLRNKASAAIHLENRVAGHEKEVESLRYVIADREKTINELRLRISHFDSESAQLEELRKRCSLLVSENERINYLLAERNKECESLRIRISQSSDFELRIHTLTEERDRLSHLISEKLRIIQEWETKYHALETLYMSVKETTEQLEIIKRRYQDALVMTDKLDPRLKLSVDSQVVRKSLASGSETLKSSIPLRASHTSYDIHTVPTTHHVNVETVKSSSPLRTSHVTSYGFANGHNETSSMRHSGTHYETSPHSRSRSTQVLKYI